MTKWFRVHFHWLRDLDLLRAVRVYQWSSFAPFNYFLNQEKAREESITVQYVIIVQYVKRDNLG